MVVARSSGPRVRAVIGVHQPAEVDVRVALRGGEARVTEQLLDGAQVGARPEEVGREGVAERVGRRLGGRAARGHGGLHEARHPPRELPPVGEEAEEPAHGGELARDRRALGRAVEGAEPVADGIGPHGAGRACEGEELPQVAQVAADGVWRGVPLGAEMRGVRREHVLRPCRHAGRDGINRPRAEQGEDAPRHRARSRAVRAAPGGLPRRRQHAARHRRALPRRALRAHRPAGRARVHRRPRPAQGGERDAARAGPDDRRDDAQAERALPAPRGAPRRRRSRPLPLPRQHRDRGRRRSRGPLAGHGALGRRELARHQLRGVRGVRRLRRVALAGAGAALVLVAALAALAYVASTHSDRLLAEVGKGLARELGAERVGFTIRGGAGVTLAGVSIAEEPGLGSQDPFLTAREIELRLQLLPLLRRRLVVDRVLVEEPVVSLVRTGSGAMNVDSLGKRAAPSGAPAAGGAAAAGAPAFQLASLRLRHGTLRYRDLSTGRTVELAQVAVDARQPQFDAPVPVAVRARLATADLRLEDIVSEGVLELAGGRPTYQGSLRAGPGVFGSLAVKQIIAKLHASPPVLDLESATLETLGGTVEGRAHLTSEGKGAGMTAQLDARGLELAQLPAPKDRPRPAGTLEVHGTLAGPPPEAPTFASGATGQGRFVVADGRIEGAGFGRPVLDALQAFLKPGVADRLRERYPDLFASDDLRFTRLSGSGRLAGGRIRSDDLVLAAPSYEARGEGSLGLDGDLDATLQLVASPELTDDLLGQSKARPVLVDASGRLAIPLRARAPGGRPHVSPDPPCAATVARALLGGSGAGEAAGDLLERLFGGKRKRDR